jgi:hypothetical protein
MPDMTESPGLAPGFLNPAVRVLWRSARTVQLELGRRRIVVDGVSEPVMRHLVRRPAPERTIRTSRPAPAPEPPPQGLAELVTTLIGGGFAWPTDATAADTITADTTASAPPPIDSPDRRLVPPRPRLAGELAALSAQHGGAAAGVLTARGTRRVAIHGTGRAGPLIAAVLGASGIGRVYLIERGTTRLAHALPGGSTPRPCRSVRRRIWSCSPSTSRSTTTAAGPCTPLGARTWPSGSVPTTRWSARW